MSFSRIGFAGTLLPSAWRSAIAKTLESVVASYLKARSLSPATGVEYRSTLSKWSEWGKEVPLESISRADVREFLDWVHERTIENEGTNPGRTANKCLEHLRAVLSWAWEEEFIETLPRFPKTKQQRDVAGRHYLTKNRSGTHIFEQRSPGMAFQFPLQGSLTAREDRVSDKCSVPRSPHR
jgi:hypothetical protein